jgi:hypothetical protein
VCSSLKNSKEVFLSRVGIETEKVYKTNVTCLPLLERQLRDFPNTPIFPFFTARNQFQTL